MITYLTGNIFESKAQVITNAVNCKGVMGKGLAAQFKTKFPEMYDDYKAKCDKKNLRIGEPYLWLGDETEILNFPTKDDWKQPSKLEYIDSGLKYLANHYQEIGISTIAMPALGCGLGGLEWSEVSSLIEKYFGDLPDIEVFVYLPKETGALKGEDSSKHQPQASVSKDWAASP
ncbi:MAG: macro domain-containing protein [Bdellovibrionaceae bacterium]|nr:macro domain-containing protein [Pseudobdellovibrionaceae bacterium]